MTSPKYNSQQLPPGQYQLRRDAMEPMPEEEGDADAFDGWAPDDDNEREDEEKPPQKRRKTTPEDFFYPDEEEEDEGEQVSQDEQHGEQFTEKELNAAGGDRKVIEMMHFLAKQVETKRRYVALPGKYGVQAKKFVTQMQANYVRHINPNFSAANKEGTQFEVRIVRRTKDRETLGPVLARGYDRVLADDYHCFVEFDKAHLDAGIRLLPSNARSGFASDHLWTQFTVSDETSSLEVYYAGDDPFPRPSGNDADDDRRHPTAPHKVAASPCQQVDPGTAAQRRAQPTLSKFFGASTKVTSTPLPQKKATPAPPAASEKSKERQKYAKQSFVRNKFYVLAESVAVIETRKRVPCPSCNAPDADATVELRGGAASGRMCNGCFATWLRTAAATDDRIEVHGANAGFQLPPIYRQKFPNMSLCRDHAQT